MNKKKILDDIKKKKNLKPIMELQNGGEVVATEVDEKNQLHLVIRRGKDFDLVKAQGLKPVGSISVSNPRHFKLSSGKLTELK